MDSNTISILSSPQFPFNSTVEAEDITGSRSLILVGPLLYMLGSAVLLPLVRLGGVPSRGLGPAAERYGAQDGPHHWD